MSVDPSSIMGEAISAVNSTMDKLESMGTQYSNQLSDALSKMGDIKVDDVPDPPQLEIPKFESPKVETGTLAAANIGSLSLPTAPSAVSIDDLLSDLGMEELGDLPEAPTPIAISLPDAPGMAQITAPTAPSVSTEVELPDAPTIALPELDTLDKISLPEFSFPELPDFDGAPPTLNVTVPNVFINWSEPDYKSEMLDALQDRVREMMAGGSGMPVQVEDALFSRARERDSIETERAVQEAVDTWAARGFSMPPGMLVKAAGLAREQGRLKAAELNRDILIQAAQWQIESIKFAVQQGMAIEQLLQNLFENTAKRVFEAARFQAEAQISVFNAQIGLFNAQQQAFSTLAQVYRTRLDGALAKLQAYKAAIDGQVAIGQINAQRVEVFKARIQAVMSNVEVYKAMMSGASIRSEAIKNQFDAYRAEVQAYSEQIGAEKVKFDAYAARVKGESTKADIYDAQARAYASTINAIASQSEIGAKRAQVKMEAARVRVAQYSANVDAYKAEIDAGLRQTAYATSVFQANVEAWKAKASVSVSSAEMLGRFAESTSRINFSYAQLQAEQYRAKIQNSVQKAQLALESAKAMGQYTAQLAAGALSAAHVSAGISGSGSASSSDSKSENKNYSY